MEKKVTAESMFVSLITNLGYIRLLAGFMLLVLCCVFSIFYSSTSFAWDAGNPNSQCTTDPCTGGVQKPKLRGFTGKFEGWFTNSRVADCPAGYTNNGLTCGRGEDTKSTAAPVAANCPTGYTNTGTWCGRGASTYSALSSVADCPKGYTNVATHCQGFFKTKGFSSMTCPKGRFRKGSRCYVKCRAGYTNNGEFCGRSASTMSLSNAKCPAGKFRTGAFCYDYCPKGYNNSGLGKCFRPPSTLGLGSMKCKTGEVFDSGRCIRVPNVKLRGNTHLWVVLRGLDLLAKSPDPIARRAVTTMRESSCAAKWKTGLYDGDEPDLADTPVEIKPKTAGTHFYNPNHKDWFGRYTKSTTYLFLGVDVSGTVSSKLKTGNLPSARKSGDTQIKKISSSGPTAASGCYELGLALHYMTDMTQPMHTSSYSGASQPIWTHPYYEAYVPVVQARFPANGTWSERWKGASPDDTLHNAAVKSNGMAPALMRTILKGGNKCTIDLDGLAPLPYNGYCFVNDPDVDAQTGIVLKDAYQSTASYIYNVFNTFTGKGPRVTGGNPRSGVAKVVNGFNVAFVDYGGADPGHFRQTGAGKWAEYKRGRNNAHATFTETGRDQWSVYLRKSDGARLQLDLWKKEVKLSGRKLYTITSSK